MGIIYAGQLTIYDEIDGKLKKCIEDVIFNKNSEATDALIQIAESFQGKHTKREVNLKWRNASVENRIKHALVEGVVDFIEVDSEEARKL